MTWVSLGVVKRLISLCIMVAPFPVGDVASGDGASADSVDAIGLGAVFVLVDELEVVLWLAHASPLIFSSVCQCCPMPTYGTRDSLSPGWFIPSRVYFS